MAAGSSRERLDLHAALGRAHEQDASARRGRGRQRGRAHARCRRPARRARDRTVMPLMSMPRMADATAQPPSALRASLTPPALPRPPTSTWALTTTAAGAVVEVGLRLGACLVGADRRSTRPARAGRHARAAPWRGTPGASREPEDSVGLRLIVRRHSMGSGRGRCAAQCRDGRRCRRGGCPVPTPSLRAARALVRRRPPIGRDASPALRAPCSSGPAS